MLREIVTIDEDLCDGCGLCIPACQEGALQLVNGKARLVADRLCDGLGACLGHCPRGAIRIERRPADVFDEETVAAHLRDTGPKPAATAGPAHPPARAMAFASSASKRNNGCPGARFAQFAGKKDGVSGAAPLAEQCAPPGQPSALTHWPVQLRLLPATAPVLRNARLLVAADCVPVAYADFHAEMLRGHAVVIACPKLDDTRGYVEKLEAMIRGNDLTDITVAHMEVPCCTGILHAVLEARRRAGSAVPVNDVVISTRGQVIARRRISADTVSQFGT
ncbi:MAG: ATP-binding protein [Phycisphaerae bacterium]